MLIIKRIVSTCLLLLLITSCATNHNSKVYYDYDHGYHTVQKGETLYAIAFRHGVDYKKVARWNNIRAPYTIYAGQRLKLSPTGTSSKTYQAKNKPKQKSVPKTTTKPITKKPEKIVKHTWNWPTQGKVIRTYSTALGGNKGIDIAGKVGQPVLAASSGKVVYSGNGLASYGNLVIVKHSEHFLSAYAHNRKLFVKEGGEVKRGEKIAELGNTGTSEVKLHFEIRFKGKPVDPLKYLPKR